MVSRLRFMYVPLSLFALCLLAGCGGSSGSVSPEPILASFLFPAGKGGTLVEPGFNVVEANKFKVAGTRNIQITALGVENAIPTQEAKSVAIFDAATGDVLASATVSKTDTLRNGYFYKVITPITLTAGTQYYIGALHHSGALGTYLHNTNVATTPTYIEDQGTFFKITSDISTGTWESGGSIRHYMAAFESRLVSP